MKNVLILIFAFASLIVNAQTSKDESSGAWTQNSTWTSNSAPGTANIQNVNITIKGKVTRNGDLGFKNNANLILDNDTDNTDTLIVNGNLTFNNGTNLTVRGSSILIVLGDLVSNNNINVVSTGKIVVTGSATTGNNTNINNTGDFYIFETNGLGGGGGSNYNGAAPGNADDLAANDSDLANYLVNELGVVNSSLPIDLLYFDAELKTDAVYLNWATGKEENFSHFEVERRTEDQEFEVIGFVQGQGESLSEVKYSHTDYDVQYGNVYYRLKSVDIDNSFEYSPIVVVKNNLEGKVSAYPNPSNTIENVKIKLPQSFDGTVKRVALYDLNGSLIEQIFDFDASQSLTFSKAITKGMYVLKVQHNGSEDNIRVVIR